MDFITDAGVFSRDGLDAGTRVLLEALPPLSGRVLDLGCGWGALGGVLAKKWADVRFVLTDVNERAAALAERNLKLNGLDNFEVVCGDGFSAVEGTFDWIVTNPPIRAGKQVIYALFAEAKNYLAPGGTLALVIRTQQGAKSAERYLRGIYEKRWWKRWTSPAATACSPPATAEPSEPPRALPENLHILCRRST